MHVQGDDDILGAQPVPQDTPSPSRNISDALTVEMQRHGAQVSDLIVRHQHYDIACDVQNMLTLQPVSIMQLVTILQQLGQYAPAAVEDVVALLQHNGYIAESADGSLSCADITGSPPEPPQAHLPPSVRPFAEEHAKVLRAMRLMEHTVSRFGPLNQLSTCA
jgi:hypothetical protein